MGYMGRTDMSKSNGRAQQYMPDDSARVIAETEANESATVAREQKAKLDAYRNAVRALLGKRAPARRISDADLDVFERVIERIERPQ